MDLQVLLITYTNFIMITLNSLFFVLFDEFIIVVYVYL